MSAYGERTDWCGCECGLLEFAPWMKEVLLDDGSLFPGPVHRKPPGNCDRRKAER